MSGLAGYGIPVEEMSKMEIGTRNRARIAAGQHPVTCGFKCLVMCQNLPATETQYACGFSEGLDTPLVAFLAALGKECEKQWGEGRLDAVRGRFVWQPLAMLKSAEEQAKAGGR